MALLGPTAAILTACFNALSPFPLSQALVLILCALFMTWFVIFEDSARKRVHQEKPSDPVPKCVHQELTETKKYVDLLEELLQGYGILIENTGTVCLQAYRQVYKEQKDHLKQYNNFREQYSDQFGFVVNILEAHKKDIAEASRAAKGNNNSLCNIIGQYRQTIEENQGVVRKHISSTASALSKQDQAIEVRRELVDARCDSFQSTLNSHAQLIEHNKKLIQDHGTSLDNVVSDHANLVAEYRAALDGLALSIAANRTFSLVHKPCGWETLGDSSEEVVDNGLIEGSAQAWLAQEREKLIKGPGSGAAPASMIENVHELSRTFRKQSNAMIKAMPGKTEGPGHGASPLNQGSDTTAEEYRSTWEHGSGVDQIMSTLFSQVQDTVQATVKAQHVEEMEKLRKAQEDIEELRAEFVKIQELRHIIRGAQRTEEEYRRIMDTRDI